MAVTLTSTAYSATPRSIEKGLFSVSFDYTSPAGAGNSLSASANATVILGPRIQNGTWIVNISGSHSSGAATMPVDIGIDSSLSEFASQKAAGTNAVTAKTTLPFLVSVSDDAAVQYRTLKLAATPGTDTAVANFKYTIFMTRDI
jgi:hypothetical protein